MSKEKLELLDNYGYVVDFDKKLASLEFGFIFGEESEKFENQISKNYPFAVITKSTDIQPDETNPNEELKEKGWINITVSLPYRRTEIDDIENISIYLNKIV